MSAGLAPDAEEVLDADHVEWADIIFVMEQTHRKKLVRNFSEKLSDRKVVVLGIRDEFRFMDTRLIELLEEKMRPHLPA